MSSRRAASAPGDAAAPGSVGDWKTVLDLSEDKVGACRYMLLTEMWWPHPVHGRIEIETQAREQMLVFRCACGQEIGMPMFAALELGLVTS